MLLVQEALSYYSMRPQATSVCGLKLLGLRRCIAKLKHVVGLTKLKHVTCQTKRGVRVDKNSGNCLTHII
jgi:hypothetical protein